jgi:ribonuclease T
MNEVHTIAKRFRCYLPIVVDIETAGLNSQTDALLEIAAIVIGMNDEGLLYPLATHHCHVLPFLGARLDPNSLAINRIDPYHPFRYALKEADALKAIFNPIRKAIKAAGCQRAVLVGHNANFDLNFLQAATSRCNYKRNPFHPFTTFDTAALSALAFGETVLARAVTAAGIPFDPESAHSALYDAEKTAELFCRIVNRWQEMGGWLGNTNKVDLESKTS